jgi:ribonuclease Z
MTSIALQLPQLSRLWLFDCGEGTQHQILRSSVKLSQLDKVFITHLHGDHLFGLSGLLASRSLQNGGQTPVTIYGPAGLAEYLRATLEISRTRLGYPIAVERVTPGPVFEDDYATVICSPMRHGVESYGYAVVEKDQRGRFDVERARALGIPPGPIYGKLKAGGTVTLENGEVIDGSDLTGPHIRGRKFVFCGDTAFHAGAVELARGADLLVHEATYIGADAHLAERANHSTSVSAAETARLAGVYRLLLTHFSLRYESEGNPSLDDLLQEARAIFPATSLAHDFLTVDVQRAEAADVQAAN